ncbi:MAG: hypothetical protein M3Z08_01220 [Chloroflexota bacterium]|nr:hypothetical protein [Chloroflexota bacterium]
MPFSREVFFTASWPGAQSARIIICERGLIEVRKKIRRNSVEVVLWKNILTIKKSFLEGYFITYLTDKKQAPASLTLTRDYQHLNELVALITHHSEQVAHKEREGI